MHQTVIILPGMSEVRREGWRGRQGRWCNGIFRYFLPFINIRIPRQHTTVSMRVDAANDDSKICSDADIGALLPPLQRHHITGAYVATDFFETCAMLITFILLGKYLEAAAKGKTSAALQALANLSPAFALVLTLDADGAVESEEEIPTVLLHRGDILKVQLLEETLYSDAVPALGLQSASTAMLEVEDPEIHCSRAGPGLGVARGRDALRGCTAGRTKISEDISIHLVSIGSRVVSTWLEDLCQRMSYTLQVGFRGFFPWDMYQKTFPRNN